VAEFGVALRHSLPFVTCGYHSLNANGEARKGHSFTMNESVETLREKSALHLLVEEQRMFIDPLRRGWSRFTNLSEQEPERPEQTGRGGFSLSW
jgi:hypothetical protein